MRWARVRSPAARSRGEHAGARAREGSPAIWLPQHNEPVTLCMPSGETLPARVIERGRDALVVVIVVPTKRLREGDLRRLELEYANPGGRVRLKGRVTQSEGGKEGVQLRIEAPELIEVVQERRHVRVAAECPIALRAGVLDDPLIARTLDLSAGGLLLADADDLDIGEQLEFQLGITPGTPPVTGVVEVVRTDAGGNVGVHFTSITPAERWRLIRFTLDCQSEEMFRHPDLDEDDGRVAWREDG